MTEFVYRSVPHLVQFQDYTEARPEIAQEFEPEDAPAIYHALFCDEVKVDPLPKSCVAIPRAMLTCLCGQAIRRTSAFGCDKCVVAYFDPTIQLMKQEILDKVQAAKDKKRKSTFNKEAPVVKGRPWKPVVQKEPRRKKK